VKAKIQKTRMCVRFYIWLNKTFTEAIMFKNNKNQLQEIVRNQAQGDVEIPTELEKMMQEEAEDAIHHHYDHSAGKAELSVLLSKSRGRGNIL
jgi:hypothetical protein